MFGEIFVIVGEGKKAVFFVLVTFVVAPDCPLAGVVESTTDTLTARQPNGSVQMAIISRLEDNICFTICFLFY